MTDYDVVDLGNTPVDVVTPIVAGARGPAGASITSGVGAPTGSARPGDLYLDATTGDLYRYA